MFDIQQLIYDLQCDQSENISTLSIPIAQGIASSASGQAGFQLSPWSENELVEKIIKSLIILTHFGYTLTQSKIFKFLGIDKNSIYRVNQSEYCVKDLIAEIVIIYDRYFRVDPTLTEHMHSTIDSVTVGSGTSLDVQLFDQTFVALSLRPNQIIYAASLLPIFCDTMNFPLKIDHDRLTPHNLMTLVLLIALLKNAWFQSNVKLDNLLTYADHLNSFIQHVIASGRVHSHNQSLDYLYRRDRQYLFTNLIQRTGTYRVGCNSFEYKATPLLLDILKDAVDVFNHLELELVEEIPKASDIIVTPFMAQTIEPRDFFLLLNHLKGRDSEGNYVIDNTSTITDRQSSRVYSLMTSLKSLTRIQLGFINYDISTCMQTIVSHFVCMENYPMHEMLISDKHSFRNLLASDLDKELNQIKQILSSADNGKQHRPLWHKSEALADYVQEASTLVDEFLQTIQEHNPDLIIQATSYAKQLYEIIAWEEKVGFDKKQPKLQKSAELNKYSLFFFVWTQIEREIRHAMMSCFEGFTHEVHDAVYSKESVEIPILEQAVQNQTGIRVKIEH